MTPCEIVDEIIAMWRRHREQKNSYYNSHVKFSRNQIRTLGLDQLPGEGYQIPYKDNYHWRSKNTRRRDNVIREHSSVFIPFAVITRLLCHYVICGDMKAQTENNSPISFVSQ